MTEKFISIIIESEQYVIDELSKEAIRSNTSINNIINRILKSFLIRRDDGK